jgi:hypothetical protein
MPAPTGLNGARVLEIRTIALQRALGPEFQQVLHSGFASARVIKVEG